MSTLAATLLTLVVLLTRDGVTEAYNKPSCPRWPSADQWAALGTAMSTDAALHAIVNGGERVANECETLGSDAFAISSAADGLCMHAFKCVYEFCDPENFGLDLPAYVADVRTEEDIGAALAFANEHDIEISIKTSGHSYTASSTASDSLLIWMQNFPKNGTITENYTDSCGTAFHAAVAINGGEQWNDVIEAVGPDYHIVTGSSRTVSAVGGWLQGGGLSFSSRKYGIGVDNVVDFRIALANGTIVMADACTNPDLFWALRGGGGGTFGVVTHAHYRLHPPTPIILLDWFFFGLDYFEDNPDEGEDLVTLLTQFLEYWVEVSPNLDNRWSGFFGPTHLYLLFSGSREDANATFLGDFQNWYDNVLDRDLFVRRFGIGPLRFGARSPDSKVEEFDSWYDFKGGRAAFNNADLTDATGEGYDGVVDVWPRLVPRDTLLERPAETVELLLTAFFAGATTIVNYYLGGAINDVADNATSVHPAMRKAVWSLFPFSEEAGRALREFLPNNVTGVCFNHHNVAEPDWRNACWGSNYDRLAEIKEAVDPDHRFNAWHSVGYVGEEVPPVADHSAVENVCPSSEPFIRNTAPPTAQKTDIPNSPSAVPLMMGTLLPTTQAPTLHPSRLSPTSSPVTTSAATDVPSSSPVSLSAGPTDAPSAGQVAASTDTPSASPVAAPTDAPSSSPVRLPAAPSDAPSSSPVGPTTPPAHTAPTDAPSSNPVATPFTATDAPSSGPVARTTVSPSARPVTAVADAPTSSPVGSKAAAPTNAPSKSPLATTTTATDVPSPSPVAAATTSSDTPTSSPVARTTDTLTNSSDGGDGGLSTGAIVGVAVAVGLVLIVGVIGIVAVAASR